MTLHRAKRLDRRAGLTSSTGIVRRGAGLTRRAFVPTVAPSPRRERKAHLDVPPATRELLRFRSAGLCEAALPDVCTDAATDVHHRQRRRDGGHAITNLLDLCRACHSWAHAEPAAARELGLIVSAYADPAVTSVALRSRLAGARRWALLGADGTYHTGADV